MATEGSIRHFDQSLKVVLFAVTVDILSMGIVIPVLPELVKQLLSGNDLENSLHARTGFYTGAIMMVYALMQFLCAPALGALADQVGRRPVLLGSLLGLGVDYLLQGFATSLVWLFIGRAIAGVFGSSITTANAYIADISTPENRAKNFGLIGVAFGIGFTLGPALGGWLGTYSLRLPFYVAAGFAFINLGYGVCYLQESLPAEQRQRAEVAKINPIRSLYILNDSRLLTGIAIAVFFSSLAHRGIESVFVLYTSYQFGWDTQTNGWALCLVGCMAILVQGIFAGPIIRKCGPRLIAIGSALILSVTFTAYLFITAGWMVFACLVLGSLGGMGGPALQSIVAGAVSSSAQGRTQGAFTALVCLANIIAPVLFTSGLFSYFTTEDAFIKFPGAPFCIASAMMLISAMVLTRLFRSSHTCA